MSEKIKIIFAWIGVVGTVLAAILASIYIYKEVHNPYKIEFLGESYPVFTISANEQLKSMNSVWVFTVTNKSKNTIKGVTLKFPQDFDAFSFDKKEIQIQRFNGEKELGDFRPSDNKSLLIWSLYQPSEYHQDEVTLIFDGGVLTADFPVSTRGLFKWIINYRHYFWGPFSFIIIILLIIFANKYDERIKKKSLNKYSSVT